MADGDTVEEQIADIVASKAAIVQAISAKGVTVPEDAKLADLSEYILQINSTKLSYFAELDRQAVSAIEIPNNVTTIRPYAFWAPSNISILKYINIPTQVSSIGGYAFSGGNGSEYSPFIISTEKTLTDLTSMVNWPFGIQGTININASDASAKTYVY